MAFDPAFLDCDSEANARNDGCVTTDDGLLLWQEEAPEEDPGILTVVVEKGDRAVLVGYAGPTLTGDPRDLDMPISVDDLFAIAHDARTDVTTSAEAVEAGRDLVSKD